MAMLALVTRKEWEPPEIQAIGGGKNACFPWKRQLER